MIQKNQGIYMVVESLTMALLIACQIGAGPIIFSVMSIPMLAETAWSSESFFLIPTFRSILAGFLCIKLGTIFDRQSPKLWVITGYLILGLAACLSATGSEHYVWFFCIQVLLSGVAEALTNPVWFFVRLSKQYGRESHAPIAIASLGFQAAMAFASGLGILIVNVGWRVTWLISGLFLMSVPVVLTWFVFSNLIGQEQVGYLHHDVSEGTVNSSSRAKWFTQPIFWGSVVYNIMWLMSIFMIEYFIVPVLVSFDYGIKQAGQLTLCIMTGSMVGRILSMLLVHVTNIRNIFITGNVIACLGLAWFWMVSRHWVSESTMVTIVALCVLGLGYGLSSPCIESLWQYIYGTKSLASIRGRAQPFVLAFIATTPFVGSLLHTKTAQYTYLLLNNIILLLLASIIVGIMSSRIKHIRDTRD